MDDLAAVGLCRERCSFLDEAIHQRYALAAAHMAYITSLKEIGHSLHLFIQQDRDFSAASPSPPHKNQSSPSLSHSNSGSHLHFHSDSDDDELHSSSPYHHDISESDHHHLPSPPGPPFYNNNNINNNNSNFMQMNFMKNNPASSIVYEQRPMSPDTVYVGESSYPYQYPPSYDPSMPPSSSSFYGSSSQRYPAASSSKPPPSPPRASPWDFLNFFNSDDNYYSQYTPSRDSKDVREEEGIPDLEDEDYHYQHEVVKEVHGDQKLVDAPHQHHHNNHNNKGEEEVQQEQEQEQEEDEQGVEYEVRVVDKKVLDQDQPSKDPAAFRARPGSRNPFDVAKEIQIQFQRASDSGSEIANILEVGKLPHHRKG